LLATSLSRAATCGIIATGVNPLTLYQNKYRIESTRLKGWDYRSRGRYFVTVCAGNRAHLFGEIVNAGIIRSRLGSIVESEIKGLSSHYDNVQIDSFVLMPNHLHVIVAIEGDHAFTPAPKKVISAASHMPPPRAGSLSAVIRSYKAGVTRRAREAGFKGEVWQARFHDHLLRGDAVISAVREYIRNNPANWAKDKENS
jgi:putative transposase